jgi:hypothetical protein
MNERELALAVAAEAPAPDPDFARQLDDRVARGFPRDSRAARLTLARARAAAALRRRPPLALAGGIASLLVALAVAIPLIGDNDTVQHGDNPAASSAERQLGAGIELDSPADGSIASPAPAQPPGAAKRRDEALSAGLAVAEPAIIRPNPDAAIAPATPAPRPDFAPGTRDRRIERSAGLTLAAPDGRLDKVAADIAAVTDRHRGFVLSSSLATGDEGATTGGSFELRIPATRLDAALADLAKLGQVRSQTTAGEDVTAAFVTAGDRLQAARAERTALLTRLENAETDRAATALRIQLDANAREINRLKSRIAALRIRTNYANVAVTLQSTDADTAAASSDDDGLSGALDDAADSLSGALELLIRALGIAIPLALLAAAGTLAFRAIQRRRREAALE